MPDYKEEFDQKMTSTIEKSVRELSMIFDELYNEKKSDEILSYIEKAQTLLSYNYNIPTQMQIYYDIASAYHDLRMIKTLNDEKHLEKEIYHFRCALDLYENNYRNDEIDNDETFVAKYIAMRSYTNLGNTYQEIGRYIVAIDCLQNALIIDNGFAMASFNLSILLFSFSEFQIKGYEKNYFHHACYNYYKQTESFKINLEAQNYLRKLKSYINLFDPNYIKNYLSKPLNLPPFNIIREDEAEYRNYLLLHRLFLDPCLDILYSPCFAVDSLNLPFKEPYNDREKEFIGLFNQIKQEYNCARYLWYKTSSVEPFKHYSDKELDLIDVGDCADHSLKESIMRTAFKTSYSLFDRIGFFINEYFNIGLTQTKISFKNVWKTKLRNKRGEIIYEVPNPLMEKHSDNLFVTAMYWLQKDFYENEEINITSTKAIPIFKMRNDMEHNCLRTGKEPKKQSFTVYTTEYIIENNTFNLLKLAREIIIYLCLAINIEVNKKTK